MDNDNTESPQRARAWGIDRRSVLGCLAGTAFAPAAWSAGDRGFEVVHDFNVKQAFIPAGSLVQAPDRRLYGTSRVGGRYRAGNVFRATSNGHLKVIETFTLTGELGWDTYAALCIGPDERLYGTNRSGGSHRMGTIYAIDEVNDGDIARVLDLQAPEGVAVVMRAHVGITGDDPLAAIHPDRMPHFVQGIATTGSKG